MAVAVDPSNTAEENCQVDVSLLAAAALALGAQLRCKVADVEGNIEKQEFETLLARLPTDVRRNVLHGKHCMFSSLADRTSLYCILYIQGKQFSPNLLMTISSLVAFLHHEGIIRDVLLGLNDDSSANELVSQIRLASAKWKANTPMNTSLQGGVLKTLKQSSSTSGYNMVDGICHFIESANWSEAATSISANPCKAVAVQVLKDLGFNNLRADVISRCLHFIFPSNFLDEAEVGAGAEKIVKQHGGMDQWTSRIVKAMKDVEIECGSTVLEWLSSSGLHPTKATLVLNIKI